MRIYKEVDYQGLAMLPMANEMLNADIDDAYSQLSMLSDDLPLNETLTNDRLENLINTYSVKITQTEYIKGLCRLWRRDVLLSDHQKNVLNSLELSVLRMESVTQKVLSHIQKQLRP